ncbi:hypothetical protein ES705_33508 [subsurface metagenome]
MLTKPQRVRGVVKFSYVFAKIHTGFPVTMYGCYLTTVLLVLSGLRVCDFVPQKRDDPTIS